MDIQKLSTFADYFVICSAGSDRQVKAILEGVQDHTRRQLGVDPRRTEGDPSSGWVLVDYNDIVLHIFTRQSRAFYSLEKLWNEAPILLRMQ